MIAARFETIDTAPDARVTDAEYRRLLGYPRAHEPGERARELEARARDWYAQHGRPWIYLREAELELTGDGLRLDGVAFQSPRLRAHLQRAGARRAMLAAVSAGRECEEHARTLWREEKPDEYFFLEIFGSAVVEHLVATLNSRICELAERGGFAAIPHYSPGYAGWDVAEQNKLFELIAGGAAPALPGPLDVLPSGMLVPKKSLLAVVGLIPRPAAGGPARPPVPCLSCSFSPCAYRRAAYQHHSVRIDGEILPVPAAVAREANYTVSPRALEKWARERVALEHGADGSVRATFRFDGTTCSNLGQPLAFDYVVTLGAREEGYPVLETDCRPAEGEEGYRAMCAYLSDAGALLAAIANERPLPGRPLDDVFEWTRPFPPSGCHCTAENRAHKWSLAFQAIHFALTRPAGSTPPTTDSP